MTVESLGEREGRRLVGGEVHNCGDSGGCNGIS